MMWKLYFKIDQFLFNKVMERTWLQPFWRELRYRFNRLRYL